jgi:hypothetical protein
MRLSKLTPLLLTALLAALLAGCGGGESDTRTGSGGEVAEPVTGGGGDGNSGSTDGRISFTRFVKDVFDNAPNSEPVSVNGIDFSFEDNNNPAAFDELL